MANKATTTKAPVIPWPMGGITNRTQAYTDKDLRALAVRAARREGGRLIDWRILLPGAERQLADARTDARRHGALSQHGDLNDRQGMGEGEAMWTREQQHQIDSHDERMCRAAIPGAIVVETPHDISGDRFHVTTERLWAGREVLGSGVTTSDAWADCWERLMGQWR